MVGRGRRLPNRNRNAPKVNDGSEQPFKKKPKPAKPKHKADPIEIDANNGTIIRPDESSPPPTDTDNLALSQESPKQSSFTKLHRKPKQPRTAKPPGTELDGKHSGSSDNEHLSNSTGTGSPPLVSRLAHPTASLMSVQTLKTAFTNLTSLVPKWSEGGQSSADDSRKDGYSNVVKPVGEEDEDAEDSRNVWSIEAFEPTPDRKYATKLASGLSPFVYVAAAFGRFPLTWSAKKDGNLIYHFDYYSFPGLMFIIMGLFTMSIFMLIFFNIVGLVIKFPRTPDVGAKRSQLIRSEEIAIIKRNVVPLIVFLTNLVHLVLAQAAFFFKREYIARYFGYWGEVVELLRLDVANKLKSEMQHQMSILLFMFILLLLMHFSDLFSACNGGAATLAILIGRCFDSTLHLREDFYKFRYMAGVVFTYIYISSKFYMMYFFFRCRLLKNLFIVWNRRFNTCVNGAPGLARTMVRSTRAYLFKDHIVTLNLIEGANHEFVLILESYLLCAMIAMVMELYHALRAVGGFEFDVNRQLDFIVLIIYLIFDFYIFFTATLEGGSIPEQAKVAFDIVKRKGMMTNRADQELWFMLSMRISFAGASGVQGVGITAGEFIYITKTFILLAVGAMTSHFIIIYQFEMPLQQTIVSDPYFVEIDLPKLLARVEGTRNVFGS